ncbi:methylated-DNA/protein-cysteinemethyltransferase [Beutenbergia cavernae DSM 12333]|uniref:Methylated-DNA--protein-cysteine methyltransferase n=1 Tax=Beutenbergia cavernae (strain ATCC BAA-8 / DSM 12333 / CCUG 43141 / JCM 11478 / NBRC 16432 / NCIMB 13614 / HKI 0122) TaxID=471853 RepID=C5BYT2_BEUC1|nr:methylated-DNA--[protein]-cysteine S-methyltransferase [Beutenbergia cavernae]ACQ79040.1 methylated-DNA/protein-cysteinemethyltransferase [Beutenbergia cavernae DSM 12333]
MSTSVRFPRTLTIGPDDDAATTARAAARASSGLRHATNAVLVPTPIGPLLLTGAEALTAVWFSPSSEDMAAVRSSGALAVDPEDAPPVLREAMRQLAEYFSGTRREFDVPLAPAGTPFQLRVWDLLREIPYGETRSYGDIAAALGDPGSSRAVGLANGSNPLSIIVPCHRVIGADGSLTGYGGGIDRKRFLLELEGALEPALF